MDANSLPVQRPRVTRKKWFLRIGEGEGGTFAFTEKSKDVKIATIKERSDHSIELPGCLGTFVSPTGEASSYLMPLANRIVHCNRYWCNTCVGIYWPVDKQRCFLAHMHGWSVDAEPQNYVDVVDGLDIQKQVFERLKLESFRSEWNLAHPDFMGNIVACCPWPRKQHSMKVVRLAGSWVLDGIRDFIQYCAESLYEDAGHHLAESKRHFKSERSTAGLLLDDIDEAIKDLKVEHDREELQIAQDHAEKALGFTQLAVRLEKKMDFPIERYAHGFLVRQQDGVGDVVEWVYDLGIRALPREQLPMDIAMYQRHEPSGIKTSECNWEFCTEETTQAWKAKTDEECNRAPVESWLPYNHGKPASADKADEEPSSSDESLDGLLVKRNLVPVKSDRIHDSEVEEQTELIGACPVSRS